LPKAPGWGEGGGDNGTPLRKQGSKTRGLGKKKGTKVESKKGEAKHAFKAH